MTSKSVVTGAGVAGMSWTFHDPAVAAAAISAPRKRRAEAATTAASVNRGSI
ncbi:MAG: hypothetical protein K0U78_06475 [Actinomycetia bacterium]|nr:hypothetical protein [Actinomycetes bacterium]